MIHWHVWCKWIIHGGHLWGLWSVVGIRFLYFSFLRLVVRSWFGRGSIKSNDKDWELMFDFVDDNNAGLGTTVRLRHGQPLVVGGTRGGLKISIILSSMGRHLYNRNAKRSNDKWGLWGAWGAWGA